MGEMQRRVHESSYVYWERKLPFHFNHHQVNVSERMFKMKKYYCTIDLSFIFPLLVQVAMHWPPPISPEYATGPIELDFLP